MRAGLAQKERMKERIHIGWIEGASWASSRAQAHPTKIPGAHPRARPSRRLSAAACKCPLAQSAGRVHKLPWSQAGAPAGHLQVFTPYSVHEPT